MDISECRVVLLWEDGLPREMVEETAAWFTRCPGPIIVKVAGEPTHVDGIDGRPLEWAHIFGAIRNERLRLALPATTFVYLLLCSPNENNWFAAEDPKDMRSGFGHLSDFSWITTAPASAIGAHYLLKGVLNSLLHEAGVDWEAMWHEEPQGCLFDFCGVKSDLALKLRTGDICGDCLSVLRSAGVTEALLRQVATLMDAQRRTAVNIGQFSEGEPAFVRWPFPVAVTRHKVAQASNELHRLLLLLDHFDSLVRFVVVTHAVETARSLEIPDRPSLGWWVESLALVQGDAPALQEVRRIAENESIVSIRNEMRGHGWVSSDPRSYRTEASDLERVLAQVENRLAPFLFSHRLIVPTSIALQDGQCLVRGSVLAGSNPLSPPFEIRLNNPLAAGLTNEREVYLTDTGMSSFKPMRPHIVSAMCPECRHERLLGAPLGK
jgi:hypothetical protein